MNYARHPSLVRVGHGVMAIGGGDQGSALVEIYNFDFDIWTLMPQWDGGFELDGENGHCAVALDDYRVMVIQSKYISG